MKRRRESSIMEQSAVTRGIKILIHAVRRKILVLDLDETLIHSHHDGTIRPMVKPGTPPDFVLRVEIMNLQNIVCYGQINSEPYVTLV
uniref:FCP1 homology domain-containing protein n=1 Tax=Syphacia muris TaxID=451379 RepID=A0A0N5ACF3_9BILA